MMELISIAFSPINVVVTVLLILMVLYWVMVILGALDVELLDIDLADSDYDAGADADVELDADGELDTDIGGQGAVRSILRFFYIGEVPIMILVSILVLTLWTLCMLGTHYLNPGRHFIVALPIYGVSLVLSLAVCRIFAMPLKRIHDLFNKDSNAPRDVMGRICTVMTTSVSDQMGQVEVRTKGAPIVLNAVSDSEHVFHKGDEAVITGKDEDRGVYTVAPVDLEKRP
ncbi:MAG: hypothetical protein ACYTBJ_10370 [Planctomycetota bacterium]|jgi:hypothetical protein